MLKIQHVGNLKEDISAYISKCKEKSEYHRTQSIRSKVWDNIFSITTFVLTSAQIMAMIVETSNDMSTIEVTVTGSIFSFFIGISSHIRNTFSFSALYYQHNNIADEYKELQYNLNVLFDNIEETQSHEEFEKYIRKYVSIEQKNHVPSIRSYKCC